jgi:hypothetical protein
MGMGTQRSQPRHKHSAKIKILKIPRILSLSFHRAELILG